MAHHWPKELLIWLCTVLPFGPNGAVNYDYIITNSINCLLIGSRSIPNGTHTLTKNSGVHVFSIYCITVMDTMVEKMLLSMNKINIISVKQFKNCNLIYHV